MTNHSRVPKRSHARRRALSARVLRFGRMVHRERNGRNLGVCMDGAGRMSGSEERELQIRGNRLMFLLVLAIGCVGLALAAAFETFQGPFSLFLFVVAALLGLTGVLDRRVKLSLSKTGIRYTRWGPEILPWVEFSGYRLVTWRRNPYLQLVPHRPSELLSSLSWIGRLNNRCARLIRAPYFSIAITPLDISESDLVDYAARFLPECM